MPPPHHHPFLRLHTTADPSASPPGATCFLTRTDIPDLNLRAGDVALVDPTTYELLVLPVAQPGAGRLLYHLERGELIPLSEQLVPFLRQRLALYHGESPQPAPAPPGAPPAAGAGDTSPPARHGS